MKFAVSSLSFMGPGITDMANLPPQVGVEIFYEWGSSDYWESSLKLIMDGREGSFSIHSPFVYVDVSSPLKAEDIFAVLQEPFDLYHRYNGEFYVIHPNGVVATEDTQEAEEMRKRSLDRLFRFDEICTKHGVQMVVENVAFTRGKRTLFNQEQFLAIFEQLPHLKCLIDTGHAALGDFNILEVQARLKDRILGYHVHDNNGQMDQHLRIGKGIINWNEFAEGFRTYTPNSTLVFEYNNALVADYAEDMEELTKRITNSPR
jgi:sugar phosphate isomerase/epimerase